MTLRDLVAVYCSDFKLSVRLFCGSFICTDVYSCDIPIQYLSCKVLKIVPFDDYSINVTIEED